MKSERAGRVCDKVTDVQSRWHRAQYCICMTSVAVICLSTQRRAFWAVAFPLHVEPEQRSRGDMQAASPILAWDTRICIPTGRQERLVVGGGYGGCQHGEPGQGAQSSKRVHGRWTAEFDEMPCAEILALSDLFFYKDAFPLLNA